jgi:hypothetical protein
LKILHNHLGYMPGARKLAFVQSSTPPAGESFTLFAQDDGRPVFTGRLRPRGSVARWHDWRYWEADFSSVQTPGRYVLAVDGAGPALASHPFSISNFVVDAQLTSNLLHYFKSQRCTGVFDEADRCCPVIDSDERVDVHGGWYDASGDTSKYLSHLSYANFMNPQQTPQVVWNLIEGRAKSPKAPLWLDDRMVDEALHGADFLMRMQHRDGYFYMTVFDRWSKDVAQRKICSYTTQKGHLFNTYQAGFRQGGGSAIAALARASLLPRDGEHPRETYLEAARLGFAHLQAHNTEYLDDGRENIIDDYCALLAAIELFAATGSDDYRLAAHARVQRLMSRQHSEGWFWADDAKTRSYFHAADAGFPFVALLRFLEIFEDSADAPRVLHAVRLGLRREIEHTTLGDDNPLRYPRQFVKMPGREGRVQFFIPHDNESGYWWQGENARLASLAVAAQWASRHVASSERLHLDLQHYAQGALDWIFGLNPFDACMMQGQGHNNPRYEPGYWNAPGGVCNGITSGLLDEEDIDFKMPWETDPMHSWRWSEQWLPHGAWLFLALAHQMVP